MSKVLATLDNWHGVFDEPTDFVDVDIGVVADLIARLDAMAHTLLTLSSADGRVLMIGGGNGIYVVCCSDVDGRLATLSVREKSGRAAITLCVGGQEGDYPEHQVCTAMDAIRAAEGFFADDYSASVNWDSD